MSGRDFRRMADHVRKAPYVTLLYAATGVACSIYFMFAQFAFIHAICIYCLISTILPFLFFVAVLRHAAPHTAAPCCEPLRAPPSISCAQPAASPYHQSSRRYRPRPAAMPDARWSIYLKRKCWLDREANFQKCDKNVAAFGAAL